MSPLPIINVSVGESLPLSDIAKIVEISNDNSIKTLLEDQIKQHYNLYGTEPYRIEYCRTKDSYQLRPNSIIGRINCGTFILQISSKFKEIETGKWLQIAHYSDSINLVRHNNNIIENNVSDKDKLKGIDYFILSFISSVKDCLNQGLLYDRGTLTGIDPNFRGKLHITKHIQNGANPLRLQTTQNVKEYDCYPNAVIKKALEICSQKSSNSTLVNLSNSFLPYFKDTNSDRIDLNIINYDFVSSLPRPDYEKALSLSKIILEGFTSIDGASDSFTPFYTIDLDSLFEKFVSYDIKCRLKEKYIVQIQRKIPHPIEPELKDNFIAPDILVNGLDKDKSRPIVIDTKNKYSMIDDSGAPKIANQDLFQMIYYCQTLNTNIAILVYPGDSKNYTKYPLQGSEGIAKYKIKRDKAVKAMFDSTISGFTFCAAQDPIHIIAWRLNLSGTLHDTRESVAQLSQFIADCVKKEIL